jgi:hypothetical protein
LSSEEASIATSIVPQPLAKTQTTDNMIEECITEL